MPAAELNDFQETVLECLRDADRERFVFISRDELLKRIQETPGYDDCHHQKLAPCVKNLRRRGLLDEPNAGKFCITNAGKAALAGEDAPKSAERPAPRSQQEPEALVPEPEEPIAEDSSSVETSPSGWSTCPGCGSSPGQFHDPECPHANAFKAGRITQKVPGGYIEERPADADPGVSVYDVLYPPGSKDLNLIPAAYWLQPNHEEVELAARYRNTDNESTKTSPDSSAYHVTRLQAVVHRPGRPLDDDDSVIIQLDDNGAGLIVRLSSFGGDPDLVLESAEQIRAVADAAIAMLKEAEGREVSQ